MKRITQYANVRALWLLTIALTLTTLFSLVNPVTSEANTTANAKIVNQVVVTFKDATGVGTTYTQKADVTVTVLLQKAGLTVSTLSNLAVASGATANYTNYAITANTNGSDSYKITDTLSSPLNLNSSESATFTVYKSDGTGTLAATVLTATITNGSPTATLTVPIGGAIATASSGAVLSFPGGTLSGNIADNAIVMVGNSGPYRVSAHHYGTAPAVVAGSYAAEDPDTLTLVAFDGGPAPSFDADAAKGMVVAERVYLKVSVTGTVSGNANGSVVHTITSSDSDNGHTTGTTSNTTTFYASSLSISKSAYDCGPATAMTACSALTSGTGTVASGNVIEYRITVHNGGNGAATLVTVADAVPAYTTLLKYDATVGNAAAAITATNNFAKVTTDTTTDGPSAQNIDIAATEIVAGSTYGSGSGTAFGRITLVGSKPIDNERNTLNFWLGAGSAVDTGGTLAAGSASTPANAPTYTIKYRVKVN